MDSLRLLPKVSQQFELMHLQLNLSNKLIEAWSPMMSDAPPETDPLLRWRLDQVSFGRKRANYICVNEATLFSFVMTGLSGKKPVELQQCFLNELFLRLNELHFPLSARDQFRNLPVLFGKTASRKIVGCVTDLKKGYQLQHEYADSHDEMELRVNNTPYPSVSIGSPKTAFLTLRSGIVENDPSYSLLRVPVDFVFAARRAFEPWPAALHCYETDREEHGMVKAYLSSQELSELAARLMSGPDREWSMHAGDGDYLRFFYEEVTRAIEKGGSPEWH